MPKNATSGSIELNQLLSGMNRAGGFPISILTDTQGLAIASAAQDGLDPERQSAVVAFVQKTAVQVSRQLGMAQADEISLYDAVGQRLVCRPFQIDEHQLILAVMVADREQSYRRLTNHTLVEIQRVWKQYWG